MAIVFTQTDLDNLKEALLTGADEVQIGDRKIKYRSKKDIIDTMKMIQEQLDGAAQSSTPSSLIQAKFNKGQS